MQTEGTKLIFIMNISVLDYSNFTSRMPQIAQIFVLTFQNFLRGMPPDPLEISPFYHWQFQPLSYRIMLKVVQLWSGTFQNSGRP